MATRVVHIQVDGDCDRNDPDKRNGEIFLHHARVHVQIDGQAVLIDARKETGVVQVAILGRQRRGHRRHLGRDPVHRTIHDDSVRVQYGGLDTGALQTKHGEVRIENR